MAKRTAVHPRHPDKRGLPATLPVRVYGPVVRRYRPPAAQWGLWELPGGFGITVLR